MQRIIPDWPVAKGIQAFTTTRFGGVSKTPWDSFNLGTNSGDIPENVMQNRSLLSASLPAEPYWLDQVHGPEVVNASHSPKIPQADASWSNQADTVCAVLTADCLPVLLCTANGSHFAAIHCGWRSLAAGVLENTIAAMGVAAEELLSWFGPAISAKNYEVGEQLYSAFVDVNPSDNSAFTATRKGHWQADLIHLAKLRLQRLGLNKFYGGHWCTYADKQFYSYRRDGVTGRMVSLIYR
ncbi:MAG: peptidoglycan editing factor PgeF [Xanthomonadales bacterium]|nr:peptidoglycan editing factor PgeF [Xanthomonadales bacterium]